MTQEIKKSITLSLTQDQALELLVGLSNRTKQIGLGQEQIDRINDLGDECAKQIDTVFKGSGRNFEYLKNNKILIKVCGQYSKEFKAHTAKNKRKSVHIA